MAWDESLADGIAGNGEVMPIEPLVPLLLLVKRGEPWFSNDIDTQQGGIHEDHP